MLFNGMVALILIKFYGDINHTCNHFCTLFLHQNKNYVKKMSNNNKENVAGIAILDKLFFDANLNRYGIMAILMIVVGCLGGVAIK